MTVWNDSGAPGLQEMVFQMAPPGGDGFYFFSLYQCQNPDPLLGVARARSHCCFAPPLTHPTPDFRRDSAQSLLLK